jgi:hypothetical protein
MDVPCTIGSNFDTTIDLSTPVPLKLQSDSVTLLNADTHATYGQLDPLVGRVLAALQQGTSIALQLQAVEPDNYGIDQMNDRARSRRSSKRMPPPSLHVIIYGARHLFKAVGDFIAKYHYFLQQPQHCNRNVEYCNPHCLSAESPQRVFTQDLDNFSGQQSLHVNKMYLNSNPIDAFTDASDCSKLPETETPRNLKTPLYP